MLPPSEPQEELLNTFKIYPNPAANTVTVQYALAEAGIVHIEIYNSLGNLAKTVISREVTPKGNHQSVVTLEDVSPGVYYIHYQYGNQRQTKMLVKF